MADTHYSDSTFSLPAQFSIDNSRPLVIVAHNRNGELTIRGTQRNNILVRATSSDGDDEVEGIRIEYSNNRLEVRTDHRGEGRGAAREARRAAREASRAAREAGRAAREATRAATDDIFRRREGQFNKGGFLGSWQIDFDDHIKHELRDIFPFGRGGTVDLEIEIPASGVETRVEAHTTSGEIRIEEVHGAVDAATASGEMVLRRVSGDLTVQSASGELTVIEPTGTLRARSASGDFSITDGTLDKYVLHTASGDIHLVTTLIGDGPYRIDAVSGDVNLVLDAPGHLLDRGASIQLQTLSGDLNVSGGARKINRRTWHYGPETKNAIEIATRTVSGDANVSLTRRPDSGTTPRTTGPDDATRPIPAMPPSAQADESTNPIPPIPPTPPTPPVPPFPSVPPHPPALVTPPTPPTPPTPATPILAESDQASALAAAGEENGQPETPSEIAELESKGDALSRLADEMAASLNGDGVATYSYPPEESALPDNSAPQADDRLAVLAALERGEIDIDEAMRRLDGASAES